MLRKSILAIMLLALAITQALAVNCDLRCSLMGDSSGSKTCDDHSQIAKDSQRMVHCHGMAMPGENQTTVAISGHRCGSTFCKVDLLAVNKTAAMNSELSSNSEPVSLLALSLRRVQVSNDGRLLALVGIKRQTGDTPLELRPGASLRI